MSNLRNESQARKFWREQLRQLLGAPVREARVANGVGAGRWDDVLEAAGFRVAVEYKVRADTASVSAALELLRPRLRILPKGIHPLLVVNHMGRTGRDLCERAGMDWLDLAGNASITHIPRLRIIVEGKAPQAKPRGRRRNLFATKSSRVAHWLLLKQRQAHTQREIVEATGIDKGHLSRILSQMEEQFLIRRGDDGIRIAKPAIMLDTWREAYQPPCARIIKGVIPSRSGEETMGILAASLDSAGKKHTFGGLSAAWMWDGFADFRLATCYVDGDLGGALLRKVGFVESERGANVWFMEDSDAVVFLGSERRNKVSVASPWFTYVDLAAHPERAKEAAEHLRENVLSLELAK